MAGLGAVGWIIYAVVIIAMFYFLGVRPQQQEKKKLQDLIAGQTNSQLFLKKLSDGLIC